MTTLTSDDPNRAEGPLFQRVDGPLPVIEFHRLVAVSQAMRDVFRKVEQYGPAKADVLITGETGTGKELVAEAVHALSDRRHERIVALNCSAIGEELFESELFGHERGAFTGAVRTHVGRFERAHRGTLFLDEIGTMPLRFQAKLLRALETKTIERVGGEREIEVDVRVIAATNDSLDRAVARGHFRPDLFHRIAVLPIRLPPLRERLEDVPCLVAHFLAALNRRYGRTVLRLTPEALRVLQEYHWPGNVRELRNVLERVYVETRAEVIGRNAFAEWEREREDYAAGDWNTHLLDTRAFPIVPPPPAGPGPPPRYLLPPPVEVAPGELPLVPTRVRTLQEAVPTPTQKPELTEALIREALSRTDGNMTRAARLLGVHKTTLYRRMQKLGITPDDVRE